MRGEAKGARDKRELPGARLPSPPPVALCRMKARLTQRRYRASKASACGLCMRPVQTAETRLDGQEDARRHARRLPRCGANERRTRGPLIRLGNPACQGAAFKRLHAHARGLSSQHVAFCTFALHSLHKQRSGVVRVRFNHCGLRRF